MEGIFAEITIIIGLSAIFSILFRFLNQPSILAYILTGIILGPLGIIHLQHEEQLLTLGQVGITLSLFMLGLELKLKELRSIGKTAILLGCCQMAITFVMGYVLSLLLGFGSQVSVYISLALSFSSTIVIIKLLSDKKDLTSLHGKLSIGLLLVQDFFAVVTIIFLTGFGSGSIPIPTQLLLVIVKVIVLVGWVIVLSNYIFPKIIPRISASQEGLFLFSLAWVFALTALVSSPFIGFSIEIGGFLAGLALANASENFQIVAKMKSLRDFFITIFFVMLGLEMDFSNITEVIFPVIVLSLFVIFLKSLLIAWITGLLGFKKRTAVFVGLSMGQVSEFGLIILFLGSTLGVIPPSVITVVVLVALITFATSAYSINNLNDIYKRTHKFFGFLERKGSTRENSFSSGGELSDLTNHIIVIGADQLGKGIVNALDEGKEKILVVDFNPDVITKIKGKNVVTVFGDISDPDIQDRVQLDKAKLVISTTPDLEDNLILIESLKYNNKIARFIAMSYEAMDTKALYKAGADYVIMPHIAGGRHLAKILLDKNHLELIEDYKARDLSDIK